MRSSNVVGALWLSASIFLASCDGKTGTYPPPPGPYEPSPAAVAAVKQPKFQPLVKALLAQRAAAAAMAERVGGQLPKDWSARFAKANEASEAVSRAVAAAQLTSAEAAQWQQIASMPDDQLKAAVEGAAGGAG